MKRLPQLLQVAFPVLKILCSLDERAARDTCCRHECLLRNWLFLQGTCQNPLQYAYLIDNKRRNFRICRLRFFWQRHDLPNSVESCGCESDGDAESEQRLRQRDAESRLCECGRRIDQMNVGAVVQNPVCPGGPQRGT